jgi:Prenyltransferase and squalene oxidase repeat
MPDGPLSALRWALRFAAVALLLLVAPAAVRAQPATPAAGSPVERAAAWLTTQQGADGGFLGFSGTSDPSTTADAIVALVAAGNAGVPVDVTKAVDYLEQNALVYAQGGPGQAAKLVLAIAAAGRDPTNVAKVNPLSIVEVSSQGQSGMIGFGPFDHALGVLALVATGKDVPPAAIDSFRARQLDDGSWSFDGKRDAGAGDTNTTAVAIQALVAAGQGSDPMVAKAIDYLKAAQTENGGFPFQPVKGAKADANSTALVVQAILALHQDPTSADWKDAAAALAAFQNPSGAFRYTDDQPDDNLFATLQALPAIADQPLPVLPASGTGSVKSDGTDVASPAAGS